ncbi:hypothetical protein B6S44_14830 [Bosea sp. Tri-44]|uniref:hypothetical protein n=1 Tax=Bosea sp. Tri-44 TaxID=1972137 RepID=UPI00100E1DF1|nr:hypothetical protein [Bosea sp. Tri-44]RXT54872.1 hypothetical protein B6S44_14830 [Bosea sp. Tri-44]
MPKPQKRDNTYYLDRLKRDHPKIHADYLAGKFLSALQAFEAAGLKKRRSRLQELKSAWQAASSAEKVEFLRWLKIAAGTPTVATSSPPIAIDGLLQPWAKARIREIVKAKCLTSADLMQELGFERHDTSLFRALARENRITPDLVIALDKWLVVHAGL